MSEEFEELEQIPWSTLAAKTPDMRLRLGVAAAMAIAVLIAGFLFLGGKPTPDTDVAAASLGMTDQVADTSTVPTTVGPAPVVASSPPNYSEADLMAVSLEEEVRLVEMHAEWFVRDYLTVDGDKTAAARAEVLIPVDMPEPAPGVSTYVEWVDTTAVNSPSPGTYVVEVAYSLLVSDGGAFSRRPVGALAVTLSVTTDGEAFLVSLPAGVDAPVTGPLQVLPDGDLEVLELVEGVVRPTTSDPLSLGS